MTQEAAALAARLEAHNRGVIADLEAQVRTLKAAVDDLKHQRAVDKVYIRQMSQSVKYWRERFAEAIKNRV